MLIMCILNYQGAKFFSRSNSIITAIKLIVPIATILVLFSVDFHRANFSKMPGGFAPYGWQGILAALPLGGVIYSFIGSNTVLQLAGETKIRSVIFHSAYRFCDFLHSFICIITSCFVGSLSPNQRLAQDGKNLQYIGDSGPLLESC